jgi:hypothetical protein
VNLPDDQVLSSPHFRYHARASAVLDPTIVDRLEANRAEFTGRYGVDPGVVDYYLFRDDADLRGNSWCGDRDCTMDRSVMASRPFDEHELVHAYMADTNVPAPVVAEGMAQYAACVVPHFAYVTPPDLWSVAVGTSAGGGLNNDTLSVYHFGQRLVAWMVASGGTKGLLDFYRQSLWTADAAIFTLQFERFWGRRLDDVAAELPDPRYAGSFCPCGAPTLAADGSPDTFVAMQEYRTIDVADESRVELASDGGHFVFPYDCANAAEPGPDIAANDVVHGATLTIARVGPGRHGVTTPNTSSGTVVVRQTQVPADDWTCDTAAANPVPLDGRAITAWVTPDRPGPTWFAFTLGGSTLVDALTPDTDFLVCHSCRDAVGVQPCASPVLDGQTMNISLDRVSSSSVVVSVKSRTGAPPTSLGVRLRRAP